ncbi:MAG: ATP-dependent Clp protease ATP-binding subunit [Planctomycetes bacterium]|nr:ATP-dependent Clp protease ATP-binding subunit [Planctomycetota bacterium]MCW8135828.1 ATP-dependent Clp protease ATP-binding subunit [Planctomycetota bacterium]
MGVARVPVLAWRDQGGLWGAAVVEDSRLCAVAASRQACLEQLRAHLGWVQRNEPWDFPEPSMDRPELVLVQVDVRPETVTRMRRIPADYEVRVVAPCVRGKAYGGAFACSVPTLGIWFMYQEEGQMREMARHYVRDALRSKSARELSRYLPAAEYALDELLVHEPAAGKAPPRLVLPALEEVAESIGDRTARRQHPRPYERDDEINDLARRVNADRASVLVVGEPGSGKTSVIVAAARDVERNIELQPGETVQRRMFWQTSASRLIAGTPFLGQWEQRLEQVIEELARIGGVLCIENLLELVRVGGHEPTDSVGAFLVPYIRGGELRVIGEATAAELDACRRLLPALADAMQVLPLAPMSHAQAQRVLEKVSQAATRNQRIEISGEAVGAVARLFRRFRPYDAMPGKAVQFLSALAQSAGSGEVDTSSVLRKFTDETGLPPLFLRDDLLLEKQKVAQYLSARVLGQPQACDSAAGAVLAFKAGLNDPGRPLGALLFAGPTGVGKTELARALSDYLFGSGSERDRLVRLDMSEYADGSGAQRLLSDANDEPSALLRRVRQQPFCVVLLDEIEKADIGVFDVLLGMLDEGRVTDRFGRVTSFQSSLIILTSNLGATAGGAIGFGARGGPDFQGAVAKFFRPEFFNRLDGVVTFNALDAATVRLIAAKELSELGSREGLTARGIMLTHSDEVAELVARAGFDHRYGARPLQRALEALVATPLSRLLATDTLLSNKTLHAEVKDGAVVFKPLPK